MQAYILKSRKGARFHFGKSLGNYSTEESNALQDTSEYLHSDTLWSALVSVWAMCKPETVANFIDECKAGNFKISSAFYHVEYKDKKDKPVFFLPKPVSLNLYSFDKPKELKRIKMISLGVWQNGLSPEDWFNEEKCTLLQKKRSLP